MPTITLSPPAQKKLSYPITIDSGARKQLKEMVKRMQPDRCIILYDHHVRRFAQEISRILPHASLIPVASGERSKALIEVERICGELQKLGATRETILICIGGGMLTDLGGFVASVYLRGIRSILVPTSFLGMVDAAIGGKTGVDLAGVKNVIGTMHHPAAVIVDITCLETLPHQKLKEGLVEVVKMAAILDAKIFRWIEQHLDEVLQRRKKALETCIAHAVRMKARVVAQDERDHSKRLLLNFGHTVGHAVESLSHFALSHGAAVSIGMATEMRIAKTTEARRVIELLKRLEMPTEIPPHMETRALWNLMEHDKKRNAGLCRIAVAVAVGTGVVRTITKNDLTHLRPS